MSLRDGPMLNPQGWFKRPRPAGTSIDATQITEAIMREEEQHEHPDREEVVSELTQLVEEFYKEFYRVRKRQTYIIAWLCGAWVLHFMHLLFKH